MSRPEGKQPLWEPTATAVEASNLTAYTDNLCLLV
jgi:hypothetical protein